MASLKTMTLHSHAGGPNPWKVAIILEELGLPYEHKFLDFKQVKEEPFISLNPNGRVPVLEDPNTGISLWEVRTNKKRDTSTLRFNNSAPRANNTPHSLAP